MFIISLLVLYGVFRFRSIFPKKRHWWQWLIPVVIAGAAFGLDYFVQTDYEKINALIKTGMRAVEEEDANAIGTIVSADYRDSHHKSKEELMEHCKSRLSRSMVEKSKKIGM